MKLPPRIIIYPGTLPYHFATALAADALERADGATNCTVVMSNVGYDAHLTRNPRSVRITFTKHEPL